MQNESPEQLLDVFKAAALSVTKLYKSSVAAETKARSEGYQDCLDDLLVFLSKEGQTLGDAGTSKLRKWASERRDGREPTPQGSESEDEVEKAESAQRHETQPATSSTPTPVQTTSTPAPLTGDNLPTPHFIVPTQDTFNFQSEHPYPDIELLDLSDSKPQASMGHHGSKSIRPRPSKTSMKSSGPLGRGAGIKRRMDLDDLFGGCFGGKDPFNGGGKRSRHT